MPNAVASVLAQEGVDFELVVVDDGSSDDTLAVLGGFDDPRLQVIARANGGFSTARNSGIAAATGGWMTFLDDDDAALPGWLAGLAGLTGEGIGVVCCGAEYRSRDGALVHTAVPGADSLFDNQTALFLAGTFAVRTDLLRAVGGFDEHLGCSQNTDLGLRLITGLAERGWEINNTDRPLVRLDHGRRTTGPSVNPALLFHGTRCCSTTTASAWPGTRTAGPCSTGCSASALPSGPLA